MELQGRIGLMMGLGDWGRLVKFVEAMEVLGEIDGLMIVTAARSG